MYNDEKWQDKYKIKERNENGKTSTRQYLIIIVLRKKNAFMLYNKVEPR